MKFSKLFFVALVAGCVGMQVNAFHPDTGESVTSVGVMTCNDYLDQASKKITNLMNYIEERDHHLAVARYASLEGPKGVRVQAAKHIRENIKKIQKQLNDAAKAADSALQN